MQYKKYKNQAGMNLISPPPHSCSSSFSTIIIIIIIPPTAVRVEWHLMLLYNVR